MWKSALAAIALAAVHLLAGHLRSFGPVSRGRGLSAAGGVAVGYVFVHLLPELARAQREVADAVPWSWLDRHVYLLALTGLAFFYSIEGALRRSRQPEAGDFQTHREAADHPSAGSSATPKAASPHSLAVFWIHVGSFTFYNALIGYLLATQDRLVGWFAVAMGLHFLVTDVDLRRQHPHLYDRLGRWIVSLGVAAGWGIGQGPALPSTALSAVTAFLSGGIILNVLKEELPEDRRSSVVAFLAGAAVSAVLLVIAGD